MTASLAIRAWESRLRVLTDMLDIIERQAHHWTFWTYQDYGTLTNFVMGVVSDEDKSTFELNAALHPVFAPLTKKNTLRENTPILAFSPVVASLSPILEFNMFRTPFWLGSFVLMVVSVLVNMHWPGQGTVPAVSVTATPATISPAAKDYLYKALISIERDSLMSSQVDWTAIQRQALAYAGNAQTSEDTYPAIRYALEQLDDHHSFFLDHNDLMSLQDGKSSGWGLIALFPERVVAQVYPDSPAALAGIQVGDVIGAVDGRPPPGLDGEVQLPSGPTIPLTLEGSAAASSRTVMLNRTDYNTDLSPQGRMLPGGLGYIELTDATSAEMQDHYGDIAQGLIRQIDQPTACGWVVDLRRNRGGVTRVMLLGIGPILGEGQVGAYVDRQGRRDVWSYSGGSAHADGWATLTAGVEPYAIKRPGAPVAVLTSRLTASAGEAIAVAFRGRPNTRSFGEATFGVPTHNIVDPLIDGAWLVITNAFDADRTGQAYGDKIMPDQAVAADWRYYGDDSDPVLRAATVWLRDQPACASQSQFPTNERWTASSVR